MAENIRVEIEQVSKKMASAQAINGLSAVFEEGLVHGIIGPNGAGKTTLMRLITGLLHPDSGKIKCLSGGKEQSAAQIKNSIGYFPQEPSLYPDLSCMEHMRFFKELYSVSEKDFIERSENLFKSTGMTPFKERPAGKLSGGMYKKLGLMCILLNRPRLLLLDEPTIGVDPISRGELWELVYGFAKEDMTVIVTTSYMDEAEKCDRVLVLNEGKNIAAGKPEDLMKEYGLKNFEDIFFINDPK